MEVLFSHTIWFPNTYQGANTKSMPCISWLFIDPNVSSLNKLKTFNSTFKVNVNKNNNMGSTMIICVSALHSPGLMSPLEGVVNIHHEPQLHVLLLNWANQSIHLFLVGCLNPCLQRTNVRVVSPQPLALYVESPLVPTNLVNAKGVNGNSHHTHLWLLYSNSFPQNE